MDDPLVIEMARQEPRVPLHAVRIGERPAPPLERSAKRCIGERADHSVLQGAIVRHTGHGGVGGGQGRHPPPAARPPETTLWPGTLLAPGSAPRRRT